MVSVDIQSSAALEAGFQAVQRVVTLGRTTIGGGAASPAPAPLGYDKTTRAQEGQGSRWQGAGLRWARLALALPLRARVVHLKDRGELCSRLGVVGEGNVFFGKREGGQESGRPQEGNRRAGQANNLAGASV